MVLSSTVLVIIVIGLLIFIHELGHLVAAKKLKIPVEKFSIGFGPALIQKKIGETTYCISLIPLGGYIKLYGEEEEIEGGFILQPLRKKLLVVLTGPFSNFILGLVVIFITYYSFGIKYTEPRIDLEKSLPADFPLKRGDLIVRVAGETIPSFDKLEDKLEKNRGREVKVEFLRQESLFTLSLLSDTLLSAIHPLIKPIVERVKKGSPAEKAGLRPMDEIIAIDDEEITTWEEFTGIVRKAGGKELKITWRRGEEVLSAKIRPQTVSDEMGEKQIGQIGLWVYLPKKMPSFLTSLRIAGERSIYVCVQTVVILYKVIVGQISRKAIGGPVMIAKLTYEGVAWGWEYILSLLAALSLNLFIINLLPIPVVDGGRSLIFIFEKIRKRRLSKKEMERVFFIGYALVILIALFALFNDLRRLVRF